MRTPSLIALVLSIALLALGLGVAVNDHNRRQATVERTMDDEATAHAAALDAALARARTITLVMAHNAAFRGFYLEPGSRASKLRPGSTYIDGANDASNPFFAPAFALRPGQVFQPQPYVSPDTHDWVIGNATPIPLGPRRRSVAIVHYELSVESFRRQLRADDDEYGLHVVDARTGRVVIDGARPQKVGAALGVPGDRRFAALARRRRAAGVATIDVLTGLANRRQLMADLERRVARGATDPAVLLLFDLDGFKTYNDSFGHLAGDALLTRLGQSLKRAVGKRGRAYRLGGDEFCVLADAAARAEIELAAPAALAERGDGFTVTASYGAVAIPDEAPVAVEALRIADQRMYAHKSSGRATAGRQSTDVLLRALAERHPDIEGHLDGVAHLAAAVGRHMGLEGEALDHVQLAAELHDVGKVAIPDAILNKPGPLDDEEWEFMRRHTIIGQRIVAAAPALCAVAKLVRASHERWDGGGYPDRLQGEDIPLGAGIVAVCDAYDAIVADRPYRRARSSAEAFGEVHRCAGTQFDPAVVAAFAAALAESDRQSGLSAAA